MIELKIFKDIGWDSYALHIIREPTDYYETRTLAITMVTSADLLSMAAQLMFLVKELRAKA